MITRIKLTNWKSHLDSELTFSGGVNALVGILGSGKSSVMQGIAFALFGTFSGVSSRKLALEDLIMKKPDPKDYASVELDFELGGKKYTVKRTLEKGKGTTSAEIRKDGKLVEVNPKGVTTEVQRILQMDYDLFQRAVYSEQNALDYFLQIPKGKRMQQIDSMLKLDRYEKARENSVSIRNRMFERRKEKLRTIEDMKDRKFDQRIRELRKEIAGKLDESEGLRKSTLKIEKERRRLSEKVVSYEAEEKMLNDVSKNMEVTKSMVLEMERQIKSKRAKMRGIRADGETLRKLGREIVSLDVKADDKANEARIFRNSVSSKNGRIMFLRDQIKEAQLKLSRNKGMEIEMKKLEKLLGENPEKRTEEMLRRVDIMKRRLYSIEAKKAEIERSLNDLNKAKDVCPLCESYLKKDRKQDIIEHKVKHIGEMELEMKEAEGLLSKETILAEKLSSGIERYGEIRKLMKDVYPLRERVIDNEGKIGLLRNEVKKVVSEIHAKEEEERKIRKVIEETRIRKERVENLVREKEEIEKTRKEKTDLERLEKVYRKDIAKLEKKMKGVDIKILRGELQEVVGTSKVMEARLSDIEEILEDKKANLKDLDEQRDTFLKYRKEAEKYGKAIEAMDSFISVLQATQSQLRDEFLKTVNYIMNEVWEDLYPYGDLSEIRILVEKDYVLQLKTSKGWVSADTASGGERSLASLALRIAFSLAFTPNLRWLILDEPTHNLDRNAIEHFGSVLRERMENLVQQVFLITHEERLSDYITGPTYKLERNKDVDGVSKITVN